MLLSQAAVTDLKTITSQISSEKDVKDKKYKKKKKRNIKEHFSIVTKSHNLTAQRL